MKDLFDRMLKNVTITKEECAKAEDMGDFYAVPADKRVLNYDKFFKDGDTKRATIEEFNSNNTRISERWVGE